MIGGITKINDSNGKLKRIGRKLRKKGKEEEKEKKKSPTDCSPSHRDFSGTAQQPGNGTLWFGGVVSIPMGSDDSATFVVVFFGDGRKGTPAS